MLNHVKKNITPGVYFDCVQTDRFKFASFSLTFSLGYLSFEERRALYLISRMMENGSAAYPSVESLDIALSMLYDAEISFSFTECENGVLFHAEADFADTPLFGDGLFLKILSHIKETINDPFPAGDALSALVRNVKSEIDGDTKTMTGDPDSYSYSAYKDAVYKEIYPERLTFDGICDISSSVSEKELFDIHKKILNAPLSYAFYVGRADADSVCDAFGKSFRTRACERVSAFSPKREEPKVFTDKPMGDASRLYLGFSYACDDVRSNILAQYLGGVPVSRLFRVVREEKRLCYSVFAERSNMGLFTVGATVGARLEEKTAALILEVVDEAKEKIDRSVLAAAKDASLMAAKYVSENRRACERFFFSSFVRGEAESIDMRMRRIKETDEKVLMSAARSLSLECTYILKGRDESIRKRGYTKGEWIDIE